MLTPTAADDDDRSDARSRAPNAAPNGAPHAAPQLARELSYFLIELAIAMHKHAIYPPGHPLLVQTVDAVYRNLLDLLAVRPMLSIGVARRQLVIEGVATESGHPLLSELAGKLHRHHIGAFKFLRGVSREELSDALATVGIEPRRDEQPLGLQPGLLERRWTHVRLFPLTYDRLELVEEETTAAQGSGMRDGRAAQLWVGLARAALAGDRGGEPGAVSDDSLEPTAVAHAINEHGREQAYDQVIVGYMLQIADEARHSGPTEGAALRRRISRLVGALEPETLRQLLDMGGDRDQRRRFVLDAAQAMNVEAVVELVQAAAKAEGQTISHSLVRMLTKLASHAEPDSRRGHAADGALREHVVRLVRDWSLDDPNPLAYSAMLQRMSQRGDAPDATVVEPDGDAALPCEPERLLRIAFELDVVGAPVVRAASALLDGGSLGTLLDVLEECALDAPHTAAAVWKLVAAADPLPALLTAARLDVALVDRLVRLLGARALGPLVDALAAATQPARREQLVVRIEALGPAAAGRVVGRLRDAAPDAARELLALVTRLAPAEAPPQAREYLTDADPLLRREAVRLLAAHDATRDEALLAAARDADERVLAVGLRAAADGCSPRTAAAIRQRLERGDVKDDAVRAAAVRAVAAGVVPGRGDSATLEWLVSKVVRPARLMRGPRIAAPSAELCAALSVLATKWADDSRVSPLLELAAINTSPAIRQAAAGIFANAGRATGTFLAIPEPAR